MYADGIVVLCLQLDLALAAQVQAVDAAAAAAAAGWDPLACLITPRPNATPAMGVAGVAHAAASVGTGRPSRQGGASLAKQHAASTDV